MRLRRDQLRVTAQYAALVDHLERTSGAEEKNSTTQETRMRAVSEQLQNFEQELTTLDRMIRENGGVIRDE